MQMICGGGLMLLVGLAAGETGRFHPGAITSASAWAFVYLTLIGSLVGFTAYVWLLQVSTPARVSTYAYVNPLIAVVLGRLVLHEPFPSSLVFSGEFGSRRSYLDHAPQGKVRGLNQTEESEERRRPVLL